MIMWRITPAQGRLTELTSFIKGHAAANALAFESYGTADPCLILVDPDGVGVDSIPPELVAREPYREPITFVDRFALED